MKPKKISNKLSLFAITLVVLSAVVPGYAQREPAADPGKPSSQNGSASESGMHPEQLGQVKGWVGSLALQAATYAAPIVAMYNLRAAVAFGPNPKAQPNTIWKLEDISTPELSQESGYVSPNVDVLYGFGFADLAAEPVILTAPDSGGRYYMIEIVDMWSNAFAYPAGASSGYKGGKFALVGPGWKGTLPPQVKRIDCPTRWIELQPRVYVRNQADLEGAKKVLEGVTIQGLSQYNGGPAPQKRAYHYEVPKLDPKVASSHFPFDDALQFWSIFSAALNENPPPESEIKSVLPQFKYLGIELGKTWKREGVDPLILAQMKAAAQEIVPMTIASVHLAGGRANGWVIPPANTGMGGADYLSRAGIAIFGLTANTVTEAIYYSSVLDGNGQAMTGEKRYTITFKQPMEFAKSVPPGFWSLTIYDSATSYSVPNAIQRYSLGSDDNLKKNPDGSFTIYLQHDNPGPDKESNWLPAPAGPFYLILRNYAPVHSVVTALQDVTTFQGPPPVLPAEDRLSRSHAAQAELNLTPR